MKLTRKLIPAFAMMLVSAIMLTTASYAWFSINNSVDVDGMSVKTTAADSVLVAGTTLDAVNVEAEANFKTDLTAADLSNKVLNPVSTVNGEDFFYVLGDNVEGDGDAKDEVYKPYEAVAFNTAYGTTDAIGYVDYVFQIKATNAKAVEKSLNLSALTLTYSGASDNAQKAFRVAVFVETPDVGTGKFSGNLGTMKTILAPTGAANYESNKAVASDSATGDVTYGTAATIAVVPQNTTAYYKVVVRLWLEGEDNTCTNETFLDLATGSFALNLTVAFEETAVTNLTTSVTTP